MENKMIWLIVMIVAVVAVISVFVNVNNTTGKAAYRTGEYEAEFGKCRDDNDCYGEKVCIDPGYFTGHCEDCRNDGDCEGHWEECINNNCVLKEVADLTIDFFECDAVADDGTQFLDCAGVITNYPIFSGQALAERTKLFGGFYESDSTIVRAFVDRGNCLTNSEFAYEALERLRDQYGREDIEDGPPFDLKEPQTTVFCDLGDVEEREFNEMDNGGSPSVRFETKVMFEDMPPYVIMCVTARGTEEFYHGYENNCAYWYPDEGTGACYYQVGENEWDCHDLENIQDCRRLSAGEFERGQKCSDTGACVYVLDEPLPDGEVICEDITAMECEIIIEQLYDGGTGEFLDRYDDLTCSDLGACCKYEEGYGWECEEYFAEWNCDGEGDRWTQGLTCSQVNCPPEGACIHEPLPQDLGTAEFEAECTPDLTHDECMSPPYGPESSFPYWEEDTTCEDTGACYGEGCVDGVTAAECYAHPYWGEEWVKGEECVGACCIAGGPGCLDDYTEGECEGIEGWDWYPGELCSQGSCY